MPTYTQTPAGLVITSTASEDIPLRPPTGTMVVGVDGQTRPVPADAGVPTSYAVDVIAGTLAAPTSGWSGSVSVFTRTRGYSPAAPWRPTTYARESDNSVQPGATTQTTADKLLLDCSNNDEPMFRHVYTSGTLTLLVNGRA